VLPLGRLHGKHAVQRGIWVPTQHLLWDKGKPRKTFRVGRSQDLPDANWLLASSPAPNTRVPTPVPICAGCGYGLSYGRRSVDQFVLVTGSPLGPMTTSYLYPFLSENYFVVKIKHNKHFSFIATKYSVCIYITLVTSLHVSAYVRHHQVKTNKIH
jgi:hypothetical protein